MSDDLIKRSDAIRAIEELPNAYNGWSDAYDKAYIIGTLEEVPKADRPQGKWIYSNNHLRLNDEWVCSRCGNISFMRTNFCDRCGASMKGAGDEDA